MHTTTLDDQKYMQIAIQEAKEAAQRGEVPVGAVIVHDQQVIARGHNLTQTLNDVTAHAEMLVITAAADFVGGKYLHNCTLYVTLEPCLMCTGALAWSQIERIVYGASDTKKGFSTYQLKHPFHPKTIITSGVCADICSQLLRDFFKKKR